MLIQSMKIFLAFGIAMTNGGAFGMSGSIAKRHGCHIVDGGKLPSAMGGPRALCTAFEKAIKSKAPNVPYLLEVRILSPHSLAAMVTLADGRKLEEQRMAVSDRQLNPGSIEWFAQAIASKIASSGAK